MVEGLVMVEFKVGVVMIGELLGVFFVVIFE